VTYIDFDCRTPTRLLSFLTDSDCIQGHLVAMRFRIRQNFNTMLYDLDSIKMQTCVCFITSEEGKSGFEASLLGQGCNPVSLAQIKKMMQTKMVRNHF